MQAFGHGLDEASPGQPEAKTISARPHALPDHVPELQGPMQVLSFFLFPFSFFLFPFCLFLVPFSVFPFFSPFFWDCDSTHPSFRGPCMPCFGHLGPTKVRRGLSHRMPELQGPLQVLPSVVLPLHAFVPAFFCLSALVWVIRDTQYRVFLLHRNTQSGDHQSRIHAGMSKVEGLSRHPAWKQVSEAGA